MALEKFHYEHNGKKFTLPKFDQLPFKVLRKIRKEEEDEQFFMLFEEAADAKALAIIDEMNLADIAKMFDAWNKDSGVEVGES